MQTLHNNSFFSIILHCYVLLCRPHCLFLWWPVCVCTGERSLFPDGITLVGSEVPDKQAFQTFCAEDKINPFTLASHDACGLNPVAVISLSCAMPHFCPLLHAAPSPRASGWGVAVLFINRQQVSCICGFAVRHTLSSHLRLSPEALYLLKVWNDCLHRWRLLLVLNFLL